MNYISTILLILMTTVFVTCGILLWKRRKETGDYSRYIQALFSWMSAIFSFTFIFRTWAGTTTTDGAFFEPEHTFVPLLMQMTFFLYPLEVMRAAIGRTKVYVFLFLPLLLLFFIGMFVGVEYTPIYSYADLWAHWGEFNVWFRLFALMVMLFYTFSLFLVPYDWRRTSADRKFVMTYALGFCLMGILHFSIQFVHADILVLLHRVVWGALFLGVAHYELRVRTLVSDLKTSPAVPLPTVVGDSVLWNKIWKVLEEDEEWRNPDMTMSLLVSKVQSNRTYVNESFQNNLGIGYNEYLMKRRIEAMVELLRQHPEMDTKQVFHAVGYRARSTVSENFRKVMGISLKDFLQELKMQKSPISSHE